MGERSAEKTYWNGEPCEARRVVVIVADTDEGPTSLSWYIGLEGTQRRAVEVRYGDQVFYLDDDDGKGLSAEERERRLDAMPPDEARKVRGLLAMFPDQPPARAGDGWRKVTIGRGSPRWGHRSLPVDRVVREVSADG